MTTITRPKPATNGRAPRSSTVAGPRQRRTPWLALAVVLALSGALLAGLMVQSAGHRQAVLVAARTINPGQAVVMGDLKIIDAAVDGHAALIPASGRSQLIGKVASAFIPAGTILSPAQFSAEGVLRAGQVVVGALLGPGALPVPDLRAGDQVRLFATSGTGVSSGVAGEIGSATVYGTTPGPQTGTVFVSLAVSASQAQDVTDIASQQRLRLVLLPAGGEGR
jgi:hypothetical protein